MAPKTFVDAAARPAWRQVETTIEWDFSIAIEVYDWVETRGIAERTSAGLRR